MGNGRPAAIGSRRRYSWAVSTPLPVPPPPLRWATPEAGGPAVVLLDQTRLPAEEQELVCTDVPALTDAIRRLVVRGAPLLGVAGGYGVALAAARGDDVEGAARALAGARPTAVNLAAGVARVRDAYRAAGGRPAAALDAAHALAEAERAASVEMAAHGLRLLAELVRGPVRILTHCNTGALAAGGDGTAFAVALAAHRAGRLDRLWIDETRPLLQGLRLTAYEAARHGMPHHVLSDAAAGSLMAAGRVDVVLTGADRIAADGATANKVGTYPLAVLAAHHGIPFIVVAPVSTIDPAAPDGAAIPVEARAPEEVTHLHGRALAPPGTPAYNPAFDVTPPALVSALVTDAGVARPLTRGSLSRLLRRATG